MENAKPQPLSTAASTPVCDQSAMPFSQQTVMLTKQDYIALKWEAHYWRAQNEQSLQREATLKAQVVACEAQIRDLTQRRYGKKSEKSAGSEALGKSAVAPARKRGQRALTSDGCPHRSIEMPRERCVPFRFAWQEQNPYQALPEYLASSYSQLNEHTACHDPFWGIGSPNIYRLILTARRDT